MVLKVEDWVGREFGRLIVRSLERIPGGGTLLVCECQCGSIIRAKQGNLTKGSTQSCGCLWKEKISTHGQTSTRVYQIWRGMKSRCRPESHSAPDYYNRGIRVCERWQKFENFYEDIGDPPRGYTIERVDNNGIYEPGNCVWATYTTQLNNRRNTILVSAFGKTQSLTLWAREYELPFSTLRNRIFRAKMDPEYALSAPEYQEQKRLRKGEPRAARSDAKMYEAFGKSQPKLAWAKEYGISTSTLSSRLISGKTMEEALSIQLYDGLRKK